jgi:hypothetical protein
VLSYRTAYDTDTDTVLVLDSVFIIILGILGSRTWPPLHLDAVVAMRSESRMGLTVGPWQKCSVSYMI